MTDAPVVDPITLLAQELQDRVKRNNDDRDMLLGVLRPSIKELTFTSDDSPRDRETKLQLLNAFDGILTSAEAAVGRAGALAVKRKAVDTQAAAGQIIAQILSKVSINGTGTNTEAISADVDMAIEEAAQTIAPVLDGELEVDDRISNNDE